MMMMMTWSKAAFVETFVDLNNDDDDYKHVRPLLW